MTRARSWAFAMGISMLSGLGCGGGSAPNAGPTVPTGAGPRSTRTARVEPFEIDAFEVTAEEYALCVVDHACQPALHVEFGTPPGATWQCNLGMSRDDHPINCVSYDDAEAFCRWAGKRLPTEDEWEWAARNGDRATGYPWGDAAPDATRARFHFRASPKEAGTLPVGSVPSGDGASGAHDLMGNVAEWTSSAGPEPGSRAVRGGSWADDALPPAGLRDWRRFVAGAARTPTIGFRCARGR